MRKKTFALYPNGKARHQTVKLLALVIALVYVAFTALYDKNGRENDQAAFLQKDGLFAAYFIDVGQGDATLLVAPNGESMLIDCGPTENADYLVKYMNDVGVQTLDYLILTHPHEDHYGGAGAVIENFPVENFLIQGDSTEMYPYDRFIYMVTHNRFDTETAVIGAYIDDKFTFADTAEFRIFAPEKADPDDANESSLALKLVYGETSFLFTGDAEKGSENAMLADGYNLKADVFSAGHHGSATSNSDGFIAAVSPTYAVVSCGKNNSYGHPHKKTLATFEKYGVTVLRTDESGDIVLLSDGKSVVYDDAGQTGTARAERKAA